MKKCELLAPAGAAKQYIAAVENGADAIYLGGQRLNARMGAGNFDLPELEAALDYGHLRGVKTYVTMNTLASERDVLPAVEYAKQLYHMGADALIIQDIGLGAAVRDALPDMPLHLSTQATVYNRRGVLAAAKLGYERVVLARETSFADMRACSDTGVETEVFVHGALCFCYSGQCHMSRSIGAGGRSANKGTCAQPCRLPYEYVDLANSEGDQKNIGCGETCYPLSPKDLWAISQLDSYVAAGVSSLKIEGRMKSPEYVATVVRIYRKYLDLTLAGAEYKVDLADSLELLQIFNRGGFTEGYADGDPGESLLTVDVPKHSGVLAGTILGCMPIDAKKKGRGFLAWVKPISSSSVGNSTGDSTAENSEVGAAAESQPNGASKECKCGIKADGNRTCGIGLEQGDIFEIRRAAGGKPGSTVVSRAGSIAASGQSDGGASPYRTSGADMTEKKNSGMVTLVRPQNDGTFLVGDLKREVVRGDKIYRMSSAAQQKRAQESFERADFQSGRSVRRSRIHMNFSAAAGGVMELSAVHDTTGLEVKTALANFVVEAAKNRATTKEDIIKQLNKLGDTPFCTDAEGREASIRVRLTGECFIPLAKVNELRRDVLEALERKIVADFKRTERRERNRMSRGHGSAAQGSVLQEVSDKPDGRTESDLNTALEKAESHSEGFLCRTAELQRVELCFSDVHDVTAEKVAKLAGEIERAGLGGRQRWVLVPLGQLLDDGDSVKRLAERLAVSSADMVGGGDAWSDVMKLVPYLESISKGRLDDLLEADFERATEVVRSAGNVLYVGNMAWIEPFAKAGIEVLSDVGLNISNSWALGESDFRKDVKGFSDDGIALKNYRLLGAQGGIFGLEENRSIYGRIPLMVTEHHMREGHMADRRGALYDVKRLSASGKTLIRPVLSKAQWRRIWDEIGDVAEGERADAVVRIYV